MTYTFLISDLILVMLEILSFGTGSALRFASAPAMEAVRNPNVGSPKADNGGDGEGDDDDDRDDTVPTR